VSVISREEGYVLQMERSKVAYPSALHSYYYLLKYLLCLSTILQEKGIYNEELLLEITSIKADELMQWAETVNSLMAMIKGKYFGCYRILQEYVEMIFRTNWTQELEYVEREIKTGDVSRVLSFFTAKEKKAGWINQIIFEFDGSFDITEPLQLLVNIEKRHNRTWYSSDHHHFYELILNEIIETRNNLKFDRIYSFSTLHQLFGFPNTRPSNLKELAQHLAPISRTHLRLADLLRLYSSQSRLKR
jgi:hypothetical protein